MVKICAFTAVPWVQSLLGELGSLKQCCMPEKKIPNPAKITHNVIFLSHVLPLFFFGRVMQHAKSNRYLLYLELGILTTEQPEKSLLLPNHQWELFDSPVNSCGCI